MSIRTKHKGRPGEICLPPGPKYAVCDVKSRLKNLPQSWDNCVLASSLHTTVKILLRRKVEAYGAAVHSARAALF